MSGRLGPGKTLIRQTKAENLKGKFYEDGRPNIRGRCRDAGFTRDETEQSSDPAQRSAAQTDQQTYNYFPDQRSHTSRESGYDHGVLSSGQSAVVGSARSSTTSSPEDLRSGSCSSSFRQASGSTAQFQHSSLSIGVNRRNINDHLEVPNGTHVPRNWTPDGHVRLHH